MKNPLVEQILFLRVKNKDHQAYGQFYDLYVERIYRFIYFKINSEDDAKDLTSEVFLKTWQYIKDDRSIKNLNAFIYMVARNCVIDFYRSRSRKEENEDFISDTQADLPSNDLLNQQIKEFEVAEVLKALAELKDEYREVVVLHYLDELSTREIAQILQKSPGAVRILVYRALNALKNSINKKS